MTPRQLDYASLDGVLHDAGVVSALPEVHGGICGVMCIGGIVAADRWLDHCLQEWQPETGDVAEVLRALELNTWLALSENQLGFEPLLPGEDEPLDDQVRSLALWCHGFLTGLGLGGLEAARTPDDGQEVFEEIAGDFAEISRAVLSDDDAEDAEQSGFALAELKEYVRVSVQLVFEQFDAQRPAAPSSSIH
jgi:uncharacterized protein YgfB (UPF0149 family)